jgi:hypothetical protein
MTVRVQLEKSLVVSLKGLGAKKNWLAANRQSYSNSDSECSHSSLSLFSDNDCSRFARGVTRSLTIFTLPDVCVGANSKLSIERNHWFWNGKLGSLAGYVMWKRGCANSSVKLKHGCAKISVKLNHGCVRSSLKLKHWCAMSFFKLKHCCARSSIKLKHGCVRSSVKLNTGVPRLKALVCQEFCLVKTRECQEFC